MISQKALEEFKAIWKEQFGEELSDDLVLDEALNLLNLFNIIYKPIIKDWLNESEEKANSP